MQRMMKVFLVFAFVFMQSFAFTGNFTVLHNFGDPMVANDGQDPKGSLLLSENVLYGFTSAGGSTNGGTVFSYNIDTTIYRSFDTFTTVTTGNQPHHNALVLLGSTLYGATVQGGMPNMGVLYSIETDGSGYSELHTFTGTVTDGSMPHSGPVNIGGTFYGITAEGGANTVGAIYSMQPPYGTSFNVLYSFASATGYDSHGQLTLGSDGITLYGMTRQSASGFGVIFSFNPLTTVYNVLHIFTGSATDGSSTDHGNLLRIGTTLYGMTQYGGAYGQALMPAGLGVIFSIEESGANFQVLHSFGSGLDGQQPYGSLVLSKYNIIYGMARDGGAYGFGTIFQIYPDGTGYTTLRSLNGAIDGAKPIDNVIDEDGLTLYGMTQYGGANDPTVSLEYGTVFSFSPLLPPQNFTGQQKKNDFGLEVERYNLLKWSASPSLDPTAGYFVYRNNIQIATLDASALEYKDHNRKKGQTNVYTVTTFDAAGNEGPPATVTVQ